ncbi:MAG TPA: phosphatidylglycerophosphatase A [Bdellovibrionota bacterium]|jgi:phosphatidylglycerophosphatase A|nr:phosphatidylglycerophosphatase A [Bdellovibrionota bacterium]
MSPKEILKRPIENAFKRKVYLAVATGAGTGYAKYAPGTFGSLLGIPLGLWWLNFPGWVSMLMALALLLVLVPVVQRSCEHWGIADASMVTVDEVLGQAITLIGLRHFVRVEDALPPWYWVVGAFLLFRILDIVKPFPARSMDRQPNGWGVMLDDVVAGIYGALVLHAAVRIFVRF